MRDLDIKQTINKYLNIMPYKQGVTGSNPVSPTNNKGFKRNSLKPFLFAYNLHTKACYSYFS